MHQVKVETSQLLDKLQSNRAQHRGQFDKAIRGWRAETRQRLVDALVELEAGTRFLAIETDPPPEDHTRDYDRVIEMVTMSVDKQVTLDQMTFRQYVMDDWQWKEAWATSNSKYLGR